jgi:hypothetical protein
MKKLDKPELTDIQLVPLFVDRNTPPLFVPTKVLLPLKAIV